MKEKSQRSLRIADAIRRELAMIIRRKSFDPRLTQVTLTDVEVTADLSIATCYFTLHDHDTLDEVSKVLKKASGFLRHVLAKQAALRRTPRLRFVYDKVLIEGERISRLLDSLGTSASAE